MVNFKKLVIVASDLAGEEVVFNANPQPIAIVFSKLKDHVLAIRYSNFHRTSAKISGFILVRILSLNLKT